MAQSPIDKHSNMDINKIREDYPILQRQIEGRPLVYLDNAATSQTPRPVVEAIDLIQQKQGIAGTTQAEAAKTISGSLNMTKAAWKNLVRAFSDKDADLSKFFDNLVTSAETAFQNILPVAEQALTSIGQVITDLAPVIGEKLPELISAGLPKLVSAGTGIVTALISGIGQALPAPGAFSVLREF